MFSNSGAVFQVALASVCVALMVGCGASNNDALVSQILSEYSSVEPSQGGYAGAGGLYADLGLDMPTRGGVAPLITTAVAAPTAAQVPDSADRSVIEAETRRAAVTIQPDTILRITVKEDPSLNGTYKVGSEGSIQFKYVGLTFMDNLAVAEAEQRIRERLEGVYVRQATVDIQILQASYDRIRVEGLVNTPGDQKIGAGSRISLHSALLRAGGVIPNAKNAIVKIVRSGMWDPIAHSKPSEVITLVDENGQPRVPDVFLRNTDLVRVESRAERRSDGKVIRTTGGVQILLLGEVGKPGYVSFPVGESPTLLNLIFRVGGFSRWANDKKIEIVRRNGYGYKEVFVVDARAVAESGDPEDDFTFEDGDVVRVPERKWPLF
jgi:protein involved in polysaccharide export with SLBB domain